MGKKFKGMYMQKCGLRDGSLVPVTALLAQGLTDSSFRYHLERQTVKSWNKTGNQGIGKLFINNSIMEVYRKWENNTDSRKKYTW